MKKLSEEYFEKFINYEIPLQDNTIQQYGLIRELEGKLEAYTNVSDLGVELNFDHIKTELKIIRKEIGL